MQQSSQSRKHTHTQMYTCILVSVIICSFNAKCIGSTMATPEKKRGGGEELQTQPLSSWQLPTSILIVISIVFTLLPLPDSKALNNLSNSKALSNIQYMLDLVLADLAYMTFWCTVIQTFDNCVATFINGSTAEGGNTEIHNSYCHSN